jgi:hypothetical protein
MWTTVTRGVVLGFGLAVLPGAAMAAADQPIGSWVLSCPSDTTKPGGKPEGCLLRAGKRFLDKGGITGDLEVEARGGVLVPVLALRGLPNELLMAAAMMGKTEASIQLAGSTREELACSVSAAGYICAPNEAAGAKLAAGLPSARAMTVRVSVAVEGLKPLPTQEKSVDLSGTAEALARLQAAGPMPVPGPLAVVTSQSPSALMGMADKALKAAGYPNGAAQLQALMAKYLKK